MQPLSTALALLIGIAGWYYLFYSRAAEKLAGVESQRLNRLRASLRRAGGLVLATPSCNSEPPATATADASTVEVKLGKTPFHLEVADTPKKQQLGLMHRKSMPADHGMLFVFPDEGERNFWMKNTHIPLEII